MQNTKTRQLVFGALIAAVYTGVSLALPAFSYGALQIRFSEALTLLPAVIPSSLWGLTMGCFLTNLIGVFIGANTLGALDVFFGTFATFVAALLTRVLGKLRFHSVPFLSAFPPVIINALVVGLELSFIATGGISGEAFWSGALMVGAGEVLPCFALGLPMVYFLEKSGKNTGLR